MENSNLTPTDLPIIILPGFDGGTLLLEEFRTIASKSAPVSVVELPNCLDQSYTTLVNSILPHIAPSASYHLIAESFSGPLAILLAHRYPQFFQRLTLVATFATSPVPFFTAYFPARLLFRIPLPTLLARYFLMGFQANETLVMSLRYSMSKVPIEVLSARLESLKSVDVRAELSSLQIPIEYIRPLQDRLVSNWQVEEVQRTNNRVRVFQLPGSHLILQTKPQEVWSLLQSSHPPLKTFPLESY